METYFSSIKCCKLSFTANLTVSYNFCLARISFSFNFKYILIDLMIFFLTQGFVIYFKSLWDFKKLVFYQFLIWLYYTYSKYYPLKSRFVFGKIYHNQNEGITDVEIYKVYYVWEMISFWLHKISDIKKIVFTINTIA